MAYTHFIGIDVGKLQLDICVLNGSTKLLEKRIANNQKALTELAAAIAKLPTSSHPLLCCEATGIYSYPLRYFAAKHNLPLWVQNPLAIKRSAGLVRGKTDQADAY